MSPYKEVPYKFHSGSSYEAPLWTNNLLSRAEAASIVLSTSQVNFSDIAYHSLIDAGYLPESPTSGNGDFALILPLYGTSSIADAVLAMVGTDAVNNGFTDGDRDVNGSLLADGTSSLATDFVISDLTNPEYTVIFMIDNCVTGTQGTFWGADNIAGTWNHRLYTFFGSTKNVLTVGYQNSSYTALSDNASAADGTWVFVHENNYPTNASRLVVKDNITLTSNSSTSAGDSSVYPDLPLEIFGMKESDGSVSDYTFNLTLKMFAVLNRAVDETEAVALTNIFTTMMTDFGRL